MTRTSLPSAKLAATVRAGSPAITTLIVNSPSREPHSTAIRKTAVPAGVVRSSGASVNLPHNSILFAIL
jgi:hypothetical protein